MDKVYILTSFDGESSHIVDAFNTEEKARKAKEEWEENDIEQYGSSWDNYFIKGYVVK